MEIYKGKVTFLGIAIGRICYYKKEKWRKNQYRVVDAEKELSKYIEARSRVIDELEKEIDNTKGQSQKEFIAQRKILNGKFFNKTISDMILEEKVKSSFALVTTRDQLKENFKELDDSIQGYIARVESLINRHLTILGDIKHKIDLGNYPVILVAESITANELMEMDMEKILGIVTFSGSEISHGAIIAKTYGIPTMIGVKPQPIWDEKFGIIDGYTDSLYIEPNDELIKEYEIRKKAENEEKEGLLKYREKTTTTLDGTKINLYANIGNLKDIPAVQYYGSDGIGLFRSEFQYLGRESYPRETELFQGYKQLAMAMGNKPTIIRTVDLGGDKKEDYLKIPEEENPIMGNRGIRLCLDRRVMFKEQLRAIYRASIYGNLSIMYPMITSVEELVELEQINNEVKEGLKRREIEFKDIRIGVMIETPAAVMICHKIIEMVDFVSLGTNDLAQYTLAMDRQNPYLRYKYNDHHESILTMIEMVVKEAQKQNKEICLCGELAADTELIEMFLKMGIRDLSVVSACILPIRKKIRSIIL